jgi:phosphatidylglycerophosphate synthase
MPAQIEQRPSTLEGTYKGREVEGVLDLYFYRRVAFRLAQLFARLGMTPNSVTLLGGVFGIAAGHLYYYRDLRLNVIGMILHVVANILDNADGQLARLTNRKSRSGRIIDSLVDHLVFLSIYVHLTLRCLAAGASPWVCLLALAAGLSHALQGAAADYCRNGYLYFVKGRTRADLHSALILRDEFRQLGWRDQPWQKFLLALYLNFTRQQEMLAPRLRQLREAVERGFPHQIPEALQRVYRDLARPLLRWCGFLMTNTRMLLLFMLLLLNRPAWYFWLELTAFNLVLLYLIIRQNRLARSMLDLTRSPELAVPSL